MSPSLVTLPGKIPAPRHKPRGRDFAAVINAHTATDEPARSLSLRGKPHMAYDTQDPHRTEHARSLNARARAVVGVVGFGGYFTTR